MRNVYLTAGHQILNGKGNGAFGIKEMNGRQFDEAIEARKFTDDVIAHLKKWYNINAFTDSKEWSLPSVINWLFGKVKQHDIAIEFHFNAGIPAATGIEVFIPETHTKEEIELASRLANMMYAILKLNLRKGKLGIPGVKTEVETQHKTIGILNKPKAATNLLVEICFITNAEDVNVYRKNYYSLVQVTSDTIAKFIKENEK